LIKSISDAKDLLKAGFTMAKCCGGRNTLFLKKAVAEGTITGLPRLLAAGYWISQTYGHFDQHYLPSEYVDIRTTKHRSAGITDNLICDGVDECIKAVRYSLREGADFIKCSSTGGGASDRDKPIDVQFNINEIKAIVETAAQVGKFVTSHCEMSLIALKQSILGGIKTIDHACLTNDECIELAMENDVVFVSTLTVFRRMIEAGEEMGMASVESYKRIHQAGATLATGTDTAGSGLKFGNNATELELLVSKCDFSPMDAIVAATKNGAKACFMGDRTGTIESGKLADIIVVNGDPLTDIKILQNPENMKMVMLEGKIEIRNNL
jgi:imidazolonepropionase-like amidohydrolase